MPVFDSKLDCDNLRKSLNAEGTVRMKKGSHAHEDFKVIFAPQIKYKEKLTDVATWYVNYSNGGDGTYEEAMYIEKYYMDHLAKNDMCPWISHRSIGKTAARLHKFAKDEDAWKVTHDDFYTIVGRTLQTHVGKAGEWFEVTPKVVTTVEFLV